MLKWCYTPVFLSFVSVWWSWLAERGYSPHPNVTTLPPNSWHVDP